MGIVLGELSGPEQQIIDFREIFSKNAKYGMKDTVLVFSNEGSITLGEFIVAMQKIGNLLDHAFNYEMTKTDANPGQCRKIDAAKKNVYALTDLFCGIEKRVTQIQIDELVDPAPGEDTGERHKPVHPIEAYQEKIGNAYQKLYAMQNHWAMGSEMWQEVQDIINILLKGDVHID